VDEDKKNWPIIVGITAGIVSGVVAGLYLYSTRVQENPDVELRDAKEIIAQCHEKIKEIETNLETLRQPSAT